MDSKSPAKPTRSIDGVVRTAKPSPRPKPATGPVVSGVPATPETSVETPGPVALTRKPRRVLRAVALILLMLVALGGLAALYLLYYGG